MAADGEAEGSRAYPFRVEAFRPSPSPRPARVRMPTPRSLRDARRFRRPGTPSRCAGGRGGRKYPPAGPRRRPGYPPSFRPARFPAGPTDRGAPPPGSWSRGWHPHAALQHHVDAVVVEKIGMFDALHAGPDAVLDPRRAMRVDGARLSRLVGLLDGGAHLRFLELRRADLVALGQDTAGRHQLDAVRAGANLFPRRPFRR